MNDLLSRAMRLLSQRDHSETELRRKLAAQSFSVKGNWGRGKKKSPSTTKRGQSLNNGGGDNHDDRSAKNSFYHHSYSSGGSRNEEKETDNDLHDLTDGHDAAEAIDPKAIDEVIAYCYQHNWLDDARFATSYINSRSRKGYGVQRIRSELLQKGIEKEQAQTAFEISEIDWCQLAKEVAQRKFGETLPVEWKEKAKVQRYLLYRGFFQEEIQSIYNDFIE
ncbi:MULTISPECIES: recombination regulator RecX [Yersinia]|uniref:recombination regulator RecX n=1 Tax=Yersinia TaxID=629 RepID=UPI000EAFBCAA|nr:recombination regulator RecX [Yersinia sp. IP36721]